MGGMLAFVLFKSITPIISAQSPRNEKTGPVNAEKYAFNAKPDDDNPVYTAPKSLVRVPPEKARPINIPRLETESQVLL